MPRRYAGLGPSRVCTRIPSIHRLGHEVQLVQNTMCVCVCMCSFSLTDRASIIPSKFYIIYVVATPVHYTRYVVTQRYGGQRVTHHGDNPLLKPKGILIATKSLPGPTNREHRKLIGVDVFGYELRLLLFV